jgi:hypothetical protein
MLFSIEFKTIKKKYFRMVFSSDLCEELLEFYKKKMYNMNENGTQDLNRYFSKKLSGNFK